MLLQRAGVSTHSLLSQPHWLAVEWRIRFKLAILRPTYIALRTAVIRTLLTCCCTINVLGPSVQHTICSPFLDIASPSVLVLFIYLHLKPGIFLSLDIRHSQSHPVTIAVGYIFRSHLMTFFFSQPKDLPHIDMRWSFCTSAYIWIIYLLTYLLTYLHGGVAVGMASVRRQFN